MAHPDGGRGTRFRRAHTFEQAYAFVAGEVQFPSTTGQNITARHGTTNDGQTQTIVFHSERGRMADVCSQCWDFGNNCSGDRTGTRAGQYIRGLDEFME